MNIDCIIESIKTNKCRITKHSKDEAQNDKLSFSEIFFSVDHGKIIEEYPNENNYQYCLVFGKNIAGEPIHSVWAYNQDTEYSALITVYRPDPSKWIDFQERRK